MNLELFLSGYADCTKRAYRSDLTEFLDFCPDLTNLTLIKLEEYRGQLNVSGLAPASVNRKLSAVRAYLTWLTRTQQLGATPGSSGQLLRGVKVPERLPNSLTAEQLRSLLNEPQRRSDFRGQAYLNLLYTSGIRVAELVGLDVEGLDFAKCEARVIGKGNRERIVFFSRAASALLLRYLGEKVEGPVFTNKHGQRLSPRFVQYQLREWGEAVGLEGLHPHVLRHTYATKVLDATGDLALVQVTLGHKDIKTTQRYIGGATGRLSAAHAAVFANE